LVETVEAGGETVCVGWGGSGCEKVGSGPETGAGFGSVRVTGSSSRAAAAGLTTGVSGVGSSLGLPSLSFTRRYLLP
jgi:hypothetical protein